jgi:Protein of unknown function (DUF3515)
MVIAIALPLLLALVVAGIAITAPTDAPDSSPLAVAPVDAPDAGGADCASLLAALPRDLSGLPTRPLAEPAQPGVRAWIASPRPVVLRCGLPRPAELTPTSELLEVDGVRWLRLDDGVPNPTTLTYVTVDRPVYVALTAPSGAGSGPLQHASDVVRTVLPATPVQVR